MGVGSEWAAPGRRIVVAALTIGWVAACGGRTQRNVDSNPGPVGATSGAPMTGGAASRGRDRATGGAGSPGGALPGGAVGTGGASTGGVGGVSTCGDGWLDAGEECDDGDTVSGDGCTESCTLELFDPCVPWGCRVVVCGDGVVEAAEACDDGNVTPGDGCDERCSVEPGHQCPVPGDRCRLIARCDDTVELIPPPAACDRLVAASPEVVRIDWGGQDAAGPLGLASAIDDGQCISAVVARATTDSGEPELAGLSFRPWARWPAAAWLTGSTAIALDAEPSGIFVVGPSDAGRIALAWQRRDGGTSFGWDLGPNDFSGTFLDVQYATDPVAVSVAEFGHSVGVLDQTGFSLRTWGPASYALHGQTCASSGTVVGDVEPSGEVLLSAASTGENNTWGCPGGVASSGPPTQIQVVSLTAVCCESLVTNFDAGGTVVALKSAPHPGGLWVVWQIVDGTAGALRWARVGGTTVVAQGTVSDLAPVAFDVAPLGGELAVAWTTATPNPRVDVAVVDAADELAVRYGKTDPPSLEQLSVLQGPVGSGVLLGYGPDVLTRLDCSP